MCLPLFFLPAVSYSCSVASSTKDKQFCLNLLQRKFFFFFVSWIESISNQLLKSKKRSLSLSFHRWISLLSAALPLKAKRKKIFFLFSIFFIILVQWNDDEKQKDIDGWVTSKEVVLFFTFLFFLMYLICLKAKQFERLGIEWIWWWRNKKYCSLNLFKDSLKFSVLFSSIRQLVSYSSLSKRDGLLWCQIESGLILMSAIFFWGYLFKERPIGLWWLTHIIVNNPEWIRMKMTKKLSLNYWRIFTDQS